MQWGTSVRISSSSSMRRSKQLADQHVQFDLGYVQAAADGAAVEDYYDIPLMTGH